MVFNFDFFIRSASSTSLCRQAGFSFSVPLGVTVQASYGTITHPSGGKRAVSLNEFSDVGDEDLSRFANFFEVGVLIFSRSFDCASQLVVSFLPWVRLEFRIKFSRALQVDTADLCKNVR